VRRLLEAASSEKVRRGLSRFGIDAPSAIGVSVQKIRQIARGIGSDHALAEKLWREGTYEMRLIAVFIDDPAKVTIAQMNRWCGDFRDWATCDTACFCLFDQSPHALGRVRAWAKRRGEFQRRAAYALLASIALHDQALPDEKFLTLFPLMRHGAEDDRNFVKKSVSWALRSIGSRSPALHASALALARELSGSDQAPSRWVGKDALRDLSRPLVKTRAAARASRREKRR